MTFDEDAFRAAEYTVSIGSLANAINKWALTKCPEFCDLPRYCVYFQKDHLDPMDRMQNGDLNQYLATMLYHLCSHSNLSRDPQRNYDAGGKKVCYSILKLAQIRAYAKIVEVDSRNSVPIEVYQTIKDEKGIPDNSFNFGYVEVAGDKANEIVTEHKRELYEMIYKCMLQNHDEEFNFSTNNHTPDFVIKIDEDFAVVVGEQQSSNAFTPEVSKCHLGALAYMDILESCVGLILTGDGLSVVQYELDHEKYHVSYLCTLVVLFAHDTKEEEEITMMWNRLCNVIEFISDKICNVIVQKQKKLLQTRGLRTTYRQDTQ